MLKNHIKPGTVLYKFQSKDFLETGYLFGTMHVSNLAAFSFYDLAVEKMSTCNLLATEIDLDVGSSYDIRSLLGMEEGQSNSNLLGAKKYAKVRSIFKKAFNVDIERFDNFLPLFIINVITETELMQKGKKSLDLSLWQKAIDLDIERTGLENFNEHFDVLKQIPLHQQIDMLYKISKNISNFRTGMRKLSEHYSKGDLEKLYLTTKNSLGKIRQIMLYDRNIIIANKIEILAKEHKVFAAMGASHLWGKYGVIAELKHKGFKLSPVFEDRKV